MSKIAVFFDAENVSAEKVPEIISFLSSKGDILFQRAYADWSINNTKPWKDQISKTPITAIQQFHHNQEQAVDKAIMMDAIKLAVEQEEIDIFTIITSDNGYYSLSLRLRELGKRVIGIGSKEKCNSIWINSCNEFTYFEDLEEDDTEILVEDKKSELKDFSLENFLEKAFTSTPFYKDTNTVLLSQMWESILRMKPDFNVKEYGKKTALEFIRSFKDKFKISDDGKNQRTFFVEMIESNKSCESKKSERKTGIIKKKIGRYRIISADDNSGEYFFYMNEINKNFKNEKVDEGTKVDFLVTKMPDLNADSQKDKNGRAKDLKVIK